MMAGSALAAAAALVAAGPPQTEAGDAARPDPVDLQCFVAISELLVAPEGASEPSYLASLSYYGGKLAARNPHTRWDKDVVAYRASLSSGMRAQLREEAPFCLIEALAPAAVLVQFVASDFAAKTAEGAAD